MPVKSAASAVVASRDHRRNKAASTDNRHRRHPTVAAARPAGSGSRVRSHARSAQPIAAKPPLWYLRVVESNDQDRLDVIERRLLLYRRILILVAIDLWILVSAVYSEHCGPPPASVVEHTRREP